MANKANTARNTLGTILGAASSAANAVGTTFDTVTDSVEIAHEFVANAKRQQAFRNLAASADFETRTLEEISEQTATRREALTKRMDSSADFKKHYLEAHAELLKAVYGEDTASN